VKSIHMEESNSFLFNIFMADDDTDDQNFLKAAVHEYSPKIKVDCFNNGMALMEHLQGDNNKLPDIIILDLNMPQKNGKDITKELKADSRLKHIPIIIYSTTKSYDDINAIYELGANTFLSKPQAFKDICKAMNVICSYWLDIASLPKK
jgi:DNA-binding response OmpR family regulator